MEPKAETLESGRWLAEGLAGVALEPRDLPLFVGAATEGMARAGIGGWDDFLAHLTGPEGGEERARLLELVVNNETYFYREPQHFQLLRRLLLDRARTDAEPRTAKLRILSAGCSTGEEPYSLAMELLELAPLLPGSDFEILGADVSPRALDRARSGLFGPNSFRSPLANSRRDAWFERVGERAYQLSQRVMGRVEFHCLDLNRDRPLEETLGRLDVVFFRNVLIYLSPAARAQVCGNLISSLRASGFLFIGTSEVLPSGLAGLAPHYEHGVFYWQKGSPQQSRIPGEPLPPAPPAGPVPSTGLVPSTGPTAAAGLPAVNDRHVSGRGRAVEHGHPEGRDRPERRPDPEPPERVSAATDPRPDRSGSDGGGGGDARYRGALECVREDRADAALELLGEILAEEPAHPDACRLMAELLLDRAEFEEALRHCARVTAMQETLAWPYVVRGRISHHEGDPEKARRELRTAIYHQPDCWPAHFYLAEVYRVLGEGSLAVRAYRNALKNMEKTDGPGPDAGIDPGVDFIGFTRQDVELTCQTNIRSLSESATPRGQALPARGEREGSRK